MKLFSSTSFLEGMWAKETGLEAENSLKVHFPNALSSYSESPTEISQLLQRHLQLHLWLEHPCFQEKHPSFSLWTPEGAWWGRDGKNRKKKLCFCFWVTLLPCVGGEGRGREYRLWISKDSKTFHPDSYDFNKAGIRKIQGCPCPGVFWFQAFG